MMTDTIYALHDFSYPRHVTGCNGAEFVNFVMEDLNHPEYDFQTLPELRRGQYVPRSLRCRRTAPDIRTAGVHIEDFSRSSPALNSFQPAQPPDRPASSLHSTRSARFAGSILPGIFRCFSECSDDAEGRFGNPDPDMD